MVPAAGGRHSGHKHTHGRTQTTTTQHKHTHTPCADDAHCCRDALQVGGNLRVERSLQRGQLTATCVCVCARVYMVCVCTRVLVVRVCAHVVRESVCVRAVRVCAHVVWECVCACCGSVCARGVWCAHRGQCVWVYTAAHTPGTNTPHNPVTLRPPPRATRHPHFTSVAPHTRSRVAHHTRVTRCTHL